ncbi:MAG: tripartite tricarboxylate transporter substrate binding protein [Burkholderiales bacterium]|nr:tripartite tricarboxylate transporter substrate binding protein [Burkholderiales bacterium]
MWKSLLCSVMVAHASCGVWAASDRTDGYPTRPIRVLDGFAAGGGSDYVARVIGPKITESLGQAVIVDNRPGAGATLAAGITARATPDGYTLMLAGSTLATSPSIYPKLDYDLLKDFAYVSLVAAGAFVMVTHPSMRAKSLADLLSAARGKPGEIGYGSSGVAGGGHLAMELLQSRSGTRFHHVPYKGAAPAIVALAAGEVPVALGTTASAMAVIKSGRVHAIAVTSAKRIEVLPEVATIAESGFPGYAVTVDYGLIAPAGTPGAVIRALNTEIRKIAKMGDVKAKLAVQGFEPAWSTPEDFRAMTRANMELWARVIKDARITVK